MLPKSRFHICSVRLTYHIIYNPNSTKLGTVKLGYISTFYVVFSAGINWQDGEKSMMEGVYVHVLHFKFTLF